MSATLASPAAASARPAAAPGGGRQRAGRISAQVFMLVAAILWLTPIVFAVYVSLRPEKETNRLGYVSIAHTLTLSNFTTAWKQGEMWRFFLNSVWITLPAVLITLTLASGVAFVVSRLNLDW